MFVVASVAKAICHSLWPLFLHWDGELLPNIAADAEETVDRIDVIMTGNGIKKLLAVPKIVRGTWNEQASTCLVVLDEWKYAT